MLNTTSSAAKLRAIADMAKAYKDLNATLKETEKITKSIATNVAAASGKKANTAADAMSGANANNGRDSGGFVAQGSVPPGGTSQNGFKQAPAPGIGDSMKFAAATAGAAMAAGTDGGMYIENDISRRRYGFYNGPGGNAGAAMGSAQFNRTMRQGTAIDPLDAARAAMIGTQSGIGGAGGMASAATMSNLVPGAGIAASMQGMSALNGARNVNMARMIGVNIRDDKTGMQRSFTDIANQIWENVIMKGYRGKGAPSKAELALSLQPGNTLANMLDMYFSGDPVLRESIVSALYQKASGGNFSKASLEATGANPAISQSIGGRNAKKYASQDQSTGGGVAGIIAGNNVANAFTDALMALGPIKEFLTMGTTFFQTVLSGPGGQIASGIAGLFGSGGGTESAVENPASGIGIGGGESTYAPINGYGKHITSGYGTRTSPITGKKSFHKGLDIGVPKGTAIHTVRDGKVVHIGANMDKNSGFGHNVTIEHADGYRTIYAHMMEAPLVSKGQTVSAGQQIGKVGATGAATGNHLHFQVQKPGSSGTVDPKSWLGGTEVQSSGTASSMATTTDTSGAATPETNLFGTASAARSLFGDPWANKANAGRSGTGGGETEGSYAPSLGRVSSGGTTVHIHVAGGNFNEEKLAHEVKRVLDDQDRLRMAVNR